MTYLWPDGDPLKVDTDPFGRPMHLLWLGSQHQVTKIINRWILDDLWWVKRIWRDYYEVITDTGKLLVIFQDVTSQEWYVQRLYD